MAELKYPARYEHSEIQQILEDFGITDPYPENEHLGSEEQREKFTKLQILMVSHLRHLVDKGHIWFTPKSINPNWKDNPMGIFEDWMMESTEEWMI